MLTLVSGPQCCADRPELRLGRPKQSCRTLCVLRLLPSRYSYCCQAQETLGDAPAVPSFFEQPQALGKQRSGTVVVALRVGHIAEIVERAGTIAGGAQVPE